MNTEDKLNEILIKLSNYSFINKLGFCQTYSTKIMSLDHLDFLSQINSVALPWELEVFAELSLLSTDINDSSDTPEDFQAFFFEVINYIRQFEHPYLQSKKGTIDFADSFLMVTAMIQFKPQQNIIHRLFRYSFFWDYSSPEINMRNEFASQFGGLSFFDFLEFSILVYFLGSKEIYEKDPKFYINSFRYVVRTHMQIVSYLSISRDEYRQRQKEKNSGLLQNSIYGFNYLFSYPFIKVDDYIALPLPYLVIDAVSESLLTRITYGNDELREKIGRYVAQAYLEKILKDSNNYDQVIPELKYKDGKKQIDSPDVMILQNQCVCFFDSKLSTPKLSLRQFVKEDEEKITTRYAQNIIQVYDRIYDYQNGLFNPFSSCGIPEGKNIFGLVVVFENSFVAKRKIYQKVFDILDISADCEKANFIHSNIKLTELHDIEQFTFRSVSLFDQLIFDRDNKSDWDNYLIYNDQISKDKPKMNSSICKFEEKIQEILSSSISDMQRNGIIS